MYNYGWSDSKVVKRLTRLYLFEILGSLVVGVAAVNSFNMLAQRVLVSVELEGQKLAWTQIIRF